MTNILAIMIIIIIFHIYDSGLSFERIGSVHLEPDRIYNESLPIGEI